MFCIKCGHELPDDARFCSLCGTKIDPGNKKQNISDNVISNSNVTQVGTQVVENSDIGCIVCNTSGKCTKCDGLGWVPHQGAKSPIYGNDKMQCISSSVYFDDDMPDIGCFGTGKCLYCLGTGFRSRSMLDPEGYYKAKCKCGEIMYKEGFSLIMYKLETPSMTEVNETSPASESMLCDHCLENGIKLVSENWKKITSNEYHRMTTRQYAASINMEVAKCIKCGTEYIPHLSDKYCIMCDPS